MEGVLVKRMGAYRMHTGGMLRRVNWTCADGYVNYQLSTGPGGGRSMRALLEWMDEKGMGDEELNQIDWEGLEYGGGSPELLQKVEPPVARFFGALSRGELSQGSLERRILLFPVNTPADIFADPNMEARSQVTLFDHPDIDMPVTYLGPFIQDQHGSRVSMRRPAPRVGEHNREVYVDELGISPQDLVALRGAGVV
jgi:crotonobetainyl-CoA:carnitine CoA-transferase CaiB-like acyl-CoA transferase